MKEIIKLRGTKMTLSDTERVETVKGEKGKAGDK